MKEEKVVVTKEEQALIDARVAVVEAAIDAAKVVRDEAAKNGVKETPEAKVEREAQEAKDLKEAKEHKVSKEDQVHLDARDARVAAVHAAIAAAKLVRDEDEKNGTMETPGVKIDREAKEKKDLKEASVLNKIEPFMLATNDLDLQVLADKLNEVIVFLNK